jgi:hypothetical protein
MYSQIPAINNRKAIIINPFSNSTEPWARGLVTDKATTQQANFTPSNIKWLLVFAY